MSRIKLNPESLQARREWRRHKVKDGNNIFRILPPFGEASNGYPYRKYQIIWGLNDPQSGRMRPYASSFLSEKKCPVFEYVKQLKERSETLKAQMLAKGLSEEDVKGNLSVLNKLIQDLSPKTVYIYNAVDKSGEVGLLELKSTAHKKMKYEMNEYIKDYQQDPTSLNSADDDSGVWFNVTRSGLGRDTEYDVKKCQKRIKNAQGVLTYQDDRDALPDTVVEGFDDLAYDLTQIYQSKTYEELQEVLEANLPDLIENCPEADLSVDFSADSYEQSAKAPAKPATPQGKKPITVKLDDEDSDGDETEAPAAPRTASKPSTTKPVAKAAAAVDDDFFAQADAILNS